METDRGAILAPQTRDILVLIKSVELSRKRQFEKFWTGRGGSGQRLAPIGPSPLFTGLPATLQDLPFVQPRFVHLDA